MMLIIELSQINLLVNMTVVLLIVLVVLPDRNRVFVQFPFTAFALKKKSKVSIIDQAVT